jgi:signal peptidase I
LLGDHCQAICPQCSQSNFCSVHAAQRQELNLPNWICPKFHVSQIPPVDLQQFPGDRIVCSKFLKPGRWDIIAFRLPANPASVYAQRIVGLPGETVQIENGAVCINGQKMEPPDSLRGIQYLDKIPGMEVGISGTKDNPAVLASDEYFVLGDFSAQSSDSRFWYGGPEGHPDYAVPVSHIKGVITHIYWPPSRWRIFR